MCNRVSRALLSGEVGRGFSWTDGVEPGGEEGTAGADNGGGGGGVCWCGGVDGARESYASR